MSVTAQLLRLFRVDQQLRGLRSRLDAAERFLSEQEKQLRLAEVRLGEIAQQLKVIRTAIANDEGEGKLVEDKMSGVREKMNIAKTNKEYTALLNELTMYKTRKDALETVELERMGKADELQKQADTLTAQRDERTRIVEQARTDRDNKAVEIKDRLAELQKERDAMAQQVPADQRKMLDELIDKRGDEAMAHVEVLDRRSHDWSCGACMMALTVETINKLSTGSLTRCSNCHCILFTEEDVVSKKKPKDNEDVVKSKKKASGKKKSAEEPAA